ncbi:MAG: hypothetical protein IKH39_00715 [Candidatus Methanomethylophilaceae archaeon]|nr:hypothetical protein [Candidatus Methanomethylophilaceae archaeon]MBR4225565.1 hypothetical protein [Candidatus Methanomethylophilaceae archaeon]
MRGVSRNALAPKLHICKTSAYNLAKKLVEKGALVRTGDKGSTPLYECPSSARIVAGGNEAAYPPRGDA